MSACATTPKHEKTVEGAKGKAVGQWHGKALVSNVSKSGKKQSSTLDLQIVGREPNSLRVDATGPFGIHLLSMAVRGERLQILLPREKKFLVGEGVGSESSTRTPALPGKVTPNELLAILFDRPLEEQPGWKCSRGGAEILFSCFDEARSARVIQRPADNESRRFEFSDPTSKAELVLFEAKANVEPNENAFELKQPDGFRRETINPRP